MTSAW
ncbi:unnamed protein product [Rhodiola kirilowii]